MNESWAEALGLTHCGECGVPEDILYWSGEHPVEDRRHWLCELCLEASHAANPWEAYHRLESGAPAVWETPAEGGHVETD